MIDHGFAKNDFVFPSNSSNQPTYQPNNQATETEQSTKQARNQATNQPINQSTTEPLRRERTRFCAWPLTFPTSLRLAVQTERADCGFLGNAVDQLAPLTNHQPLSSHVKELSFN